MEADQRASFNLVATRIGMSPGSDEYSFAYAFQTRLAESVATTDDTGARSLGRETGIEEAIVWRVISWRMLAELGGRALFEQRTKGALEGTFVPHPALDALAKTYERLIRAMDKLTEHSGDERHGRPQGLPDIMKPILEEAEVVFDELLGPGGFPGRAPENGTVRHPEAQG